MADKQTHKTADKTDKTVESAEAADTKAVETAQDQGFIGVKVDPLPNSAYSLESGPDSPTILEQQEAVRKAAEG
jgi:hypothetical protein